MTPSFSWCLSRGGEVHPLLDAACAWQGGWNTSEAPCLNRCLWIYNSSVIKKNYNRLIFFLFYFFFNSNFSQLRGLPERYLQVEYFMDRFFSPFQIQFLVTKEQSVKPASILAAAFGWKFLPIPTIAPPPSCALGRQVCVSCSSPEITKM